uniref:Uncharacterized protein n=1 Tax=Timema genevievae TaxID=629358 RepID=A0A7R9PK21_TIMGE|nr:unnamed protein product [Timema genevievae]
MEGSTTHYQPDRSSVDLYQEEMHLSCVSRCISGVGERERALRQPTASFRQGQSRPLLAQSVNYRSSHHPTGRVVQLVPSGLLDWWTNLLLHSIRSTKEKGGGRGHRSQSNKLYHISANSLSVAHLVLWWQEVNVLVLVATSA